ncbi:MAG: oligosaccharide flippase family protein [Anaerolineales bacterium]|nr:oligosaccharide flippase family protein [Anaerolineales bacterium]
MSFLSGMTLLFLLLYWLWGRVYRPEFDEHAVQRVAKNSLVPMSLSLFNKAIDFAFAMLYVRILGPTGTGEYYFVVAIYGFFEIISRYGLGTLLTRDVAADKNQSSRYLTNVIALRTLLWAVAIPLMALVVLGYKVIGDINPAFQAINQPEVQALALLAIGMLFANYADALSSMFYAFEKMEYPAGLTNAVALFKVALGAAVLLAGFGYVGLAAVALVMNVVQVLWLWLMLNRTLFKPQWLWDWSLQKWMLREWAVDDQPSARHDLLADRRLDLASAGRGRRRWALQHRSQIPGWAEHHSQRFDAGGLSADEPAGAPRKR